MYVSHSGLRPRVFPLLSGRQHVHAVASSEAYTYVLGTAFHLPPYLLIRARQGLQGNGRRNQTCHGSIGVRLRRQIW